MNLINWGRLAVVSVAAMLCTASANAPVPVDPHAAPAPGASAVAPHAIDSLSPDEALHRLVAGNERFVSHTAHRSHQDQARRCETFTGGQHPIAAVLACADSRAPVELLFDQGIGDLFVIRVAGNVADEDEIGTIEYGTGHLNVPLVVVLGHSKCGAVTAVVENAPVSGHIAKLVDNIVPAVESVRKAMPSLHGEALVQGSIDANVLQSMQDLLSRSGEVRHLVGSKKLKVVGAVYDLHNGTIRWLGEHPRQADLLGAAHADTPGKHEPSHAAPTASSPGHAEHPYAKEPAHQRAPTAPATQTSAPPHQAGTLTGMLIPASFLGGAALISGSLIRSMKARPHQTAQAAQAT